jgi:hypothetical protein
MEVSREVLIKRIMDKVIGEPNSGCWLWTGAATDKGYGVVTRNPHQLVLAHRLSFEVFVHPLTPGKWICHKCDVTYCVNPAHLYEGTPKTNSMDMAARGRQWLQRSPEKIPWRKFPADMAEKVASEPGYVTDIAAAYGCSKQYVSWARMKFNTQHKPLPPRRVQK